MKELIECFEIDKVYSNEEIFKSIGVSNAGGVRLSLGEDSEVRRMVIMTSVPTARQAKENPYHDRVEGDILVYTGAGREGDQGISGLNRRILQQAEKPFPVYCFTIIHNRKNKKYSNKRWQFLGMLEFQRHHKEIQLDIRGETRQVWLFEFRIHREIRTVCIKNDANITELFDREPAQCSLIDQDDQLVVDTHPLNVIRQREGIVEQNEEIRRRLLGLTPRGFEELIRDVVSLSGFERVEVTRYSQDGGIDINAYVGVSMWPLGSLLVQIQAKRWLHTVGRREIAELRGSLQPFAHGAVVTTSHFTKAAIDEAKALGKNPITLIDGYNLAAVISRIGSQIKQGLINTQDT